MLHILCPKERLVESVDFLRTRQNIGALFDNSLSMVPHVNTLWNSASHLLHNIICIILMFV